MKEVLKMEFNNEDIEKIVKKTHCSKEDAIKDWYDEEAEHWIYQHLHKKYGTLEKWLKAWEKMSLRK